jgi:hypothetical protein
LRGLTQPFRIVSALLYVDLILTHGITPNIGVAEEFLRWRRNLSFWIVGIRCRADVVGEQMNDLFLVFFVEKRPCFRMSNKFLPRN